MSLPCTRCQTSGFLNLHLIPDDEVPEEDENFFEAVKRWAKDHDEPDVQVCDCCGDGEEWHGVPGEHYNSEDPQGQGGPYKYNGGLCECH